MICKICNTAASIVTSKSGVVFCAACKPILYELKPIDNLHEGFVVKFSNGFRVKLKYEEYCKLHSIVTNVSNLSVWETLSQGKSFDELLDRTPDEFDAFVKRTSEELNGKFTTIDFEHKMLFDELRKQNFHTRKEQAEYIFKLNGYNSKILFEMIDNKDYSSTIWRMIRPKFAKPFMVDDEG